MKNITKYLLAISLVLFFAGCKMTDMQSKEECLSDFFSKAQAGSWYTMYEDIHPDNPSRNNYKNGEPFKTIYTTSVSYSIASKSGDTYQVNVSSSGTETFIFRSQTSDNMFEGDTWLIYSFTNGSSTY